MLYLHNIRDDLFLCAIYMAFINCDKRALLRCVNCTREAQSYINVWFSKVLNKQKSRRLKRNFPLLPLAADTAPFPDPERKRKRIKYASEPLFNTSAAADFHTVCQNALRHERCGK